MEASQFFYLGYRYVFNIMNMEFLILGNNKMFPIKLKMSLREKELISLSYLCMILFDMFPFQAGPSKCHWCPCSYPYSLCDYHLCCFHTFQVFTPQQRYVYYNKQNKNIL